MDSSDVFCRSFSWPVKQMLGFGGGCRPDLDPDPGHISVIQMLTLAVEFKFCFVVFSRAILGVWCRYCVPPTVFFF